MYDESLWLPQPPNMSVKGSIQASGTGAPGAAAAASYDSHKPQTPPPDLPSLLLDSRIVYLGMPVRVVRVCVCLFVSWHCCCSWRPCTITPVSSF